MLANANMLLISCLVKLKLLPAKNKQWQRRWWLLPHFIFNQYFRHCRSFNVCEKQKTVSCAYGSPELLSRVAVTILKGNRSRRINIRPKKQNKGEMLFHCSFILLKEFLAWAKNRWYMPMPTYFQKGDSQKGEYGYGWWVDIFSMSNKGWSETITDYVFLLAEQHFNLSRELCRFFCEKV